MGATSIIHYRDLHGIPVVEKTVTKYHEHGVFDNEVKWLTKIHNNWYGLPAYCPFPLLIYTEHVGKNLVMTYCGEPISKRNIPKNWERQAENILDYLQLINCSHNDIKPQELLVKDKRLYLCDFGWATPLGEPIPETWPKKIGGKFLSSEAEKENKRNDRYSIYKSIEHILK